MGRWRLKKPASRLFTQPFIDSGADERNIKALLHWPGCAGIHRSPVNSPHIWPVTRKCSHLMTSWRRHFLTVSSKVLQWWFRGNCIILISATVKYCISMKWERIQYFCKRSNKSVLSLTAWTKWQQFWRWYFEMDFHEWKCILIAILLKFDIGLHWHR